MNDINKNIGINISNLRKGRSQSQQSLAKQVGVTRQQICRIEKGYGTSSSTLNRIARIYEVDVADLTKVPEEKKDYPVSKYKNYLPYSLWEDISSKVYDSNSEIISREVLKNYTDELIEKMSNSDGFIQERLKEQLGTQDKYILTYEEILTYTRKIFFDFCAYAISIEKNDLPVTIKENHI